MSWITNQVTVSRVKALAGDKGLSVKYYPLEEPSVPRTDGNVLWLNCPNIIWEKERMEDWEAEFYHEIGHNSVENRDIFPVIRDNEVGMKSRLGMALNVLSDLKQDEQQYGRYRGRDRVMSEHSGRCLKNLLNKDGGLLDNVAVDKAIENGLRTQEEIDFLQTLCGYMNVKEAQYHDGTLPYVEDMLSRMSPTAQKRIENLIEDPNFEPFGATGEELYNLAVRFMEANDVSKEEAEEEAQEQYQQAQEGEGEEVGREGTGATGLGGEMSDVFEESVDHAHSDDYNDVQADNSDEEGESSKRTGAGAGRGKLSEDAEFEHGMYCPDYNTYVPSNWDEMVVHDYSKNKVGQHHKASRILSTTEEGRFLGTKVKKLLQSLSQTRFEHGRKNGKLGRNLHRATLKDSGNYQRKIFKKKADVIDLDVSISLVVDGSGSMAGSKYEHAAAAALIMTDMCRQLNIKCEIVVFSETWDGTIDPTLAHGVIKPFGARPTQEAMANSFGHFEDYYMGNNLDGESIMWSAIRLLQQKSNRRIMIVFSDGMPASSYSGAGMCTREVIKELEARKDMEIYGIGIKSDSVKSFYKDRAVIHHSSELESKLLEVIQTKIIHGGQ